MSDSTPPAATFDRLLALRQAVGAGGRRRLEGWRDAIADPDYLPSAHNLACYLSFRHRDLRPLQRELMALGLSSLGRCESRVLPTLDATVEALETRLGHPPGRPDAAAAFFDGPRRLAERTEALFGPLRPGWQTHVMVTLAADLADDEPTMDQLVQSGMCIARINCAKEGPEVWSALAANARRAGRACGHPVRVAMDLCGPRARTGTVRKQAARKLRSQDRILLAARRSVKDPAAEAPDFVIDCSLPAILPQLPEGAQVTIDEGSIEAEVVRAGERSVELEVKRTGPKGARLKPNKGLNFPGTALKLDPLTAKDRKDLDVVAREADIVGYSFVQTGDDVRRLHAELGRRGRGPQEIGLLAKVETQLAIQRLPEIIVAGAGAGPFGVMIARGDLAVEVGYPRLAEIQEEILWLCEAAHVPAVWATEVMHHLVREGRPTRAEMTDAAMAERAECIMLNKGPFLPEAVALLGDLLGRMSAHQSKKSPQLRALTSW